MKVETPWESPDEIVAIALAAIVGAVVGCNLTRLYRQRVRPAIFNQ